MLNLSELINLAFLRILNENSLLGRTREDGRHINLAEHVDCLLHPDHGRQRADTSLPNESFI